MSYSSKHPVLTHSRYSDHSCRRWRLRLSRRTQGGQVEDLRILRDAVRQLLVERRADVMALHLAETTEDPGQFSGVPNGHQDAGGN